jgi:hypothetical protein
MGNIVVTPHRDAAAGYRKESASSVLTTTAVASSYLTIKADIYGGCTTTYRMCVGA